MNQSEKKINRVVPLEINKINNIVQFMKEKDKLTSTLTVEIYIMN